MIRQWLRARRDRRTLEEWERRGRPVPPPHIVKQRLLRAYAERYGLRTLVETGTYRGDMVEAMRPVFEKIVSIELGQDLFTAARKRFKRVAHVELIQGDSATELRRVVERLDRPSLFWLDGHYSAGETARGQKDTPIYEELDQILGARDLGHVIVIDDARAFGSDPAYPSIDELRAFVLAKRPGARISIQDDSIRIEPPAATSAS
ncbi:MAG TPA: hypothetical protein VLV16_04845 [Gemmatimonadales bacterium]|nr:hypothetical protein [Gemmatimonadales bacterium]